ncbi:hypothetical protein [uncultured Helicobacter sp.]|uniref:hypothetical protein n=1 Tax=uncultured Helicobacter sp. TaxID=175537 RepID=UPI00374FD4A6
MGDFCFISSLGACGALDSALDSKMGVCESSSWEICLDVADDGRSCALRSWILDSALPSCAALFGILACVLGVLGSFRFCAGSFAS